MPPGLAGIFPDTGQGLAGLIGSRSDSIQG